MLHAADTIFKLQLHWWHDIKNGITGELLLAKMHSEYVFQLLDCFKNCPLRTQQFSLITRCSKLACFIYVARAMFLAVDMGKKLASDIRCHVMYEPAVTLLFNAFSGVKRNTVEQTFSWSGLPSQWTYHIKLSNASVWNSSIMRAEKGTSVPTFFCLLGVELTTSARV